MGKIVGNIYEISRSGFKELGWLVETKVTEDVYKPSSFVWIK